MKELLEMFIIFARIGGFTFGGGYAMLPMLEKEVVNNKHWATEEELMDYYAIGQCTPGIIAINTATFIGYKVKGIPGAIMATLGVIAPSLVIITVITAFISNFMDLWFVSSAFAGIRACVCVLIFDAVLKLGKKALVDNAGEEAGMNVYLEIFIRFFSCGLFAVGGGLATLPFLYEISRETGWYTYQDISNMIAISESTPGPMGVNMATYVGFHIEGIAGALIAPLSLVLPSVIIILIISRVLDRFKSAPVVQNVLYGLRAASAALIAAAGLGVAKIAFLTMDDEAVTALPGLNVKAVILAVAVYVGLKKFKKHPIVYIICSAAAGVVLRF